MSSEAIDKGARIEITGGRQGVGVCGEVFWKGESRYGDGARYGVRGDDGETYWVDESEVKPSTREPTQPPEGERFDKGDLVSFKDRGREGNGTVFWVGQSRGGPGQRLGVRDSKPDDPENDAVWIDARQATRLAAASARPQGDDSDQPPWSPPLAMDDLPPAAPLDDSVVDAWSHEPPDEAGQDW